MIEGIAADERHRGTGRRVDHADVVRSGDPDPLHPVLLGCDGRVEQQGIALLEVLEHPEEPVAVGRDADVPRRPWQGGAFDPAGREVEHRVRRAVVDRHLELEPRDAQDGERWRRFVLQRDLVGLHPVRRPEGHVDLPAPGERARRGSWCRRRRGCGGRCGRASGRRAGCRGCRCVAAARGQRRREDQREADDRNGAVRARQLWDHGTLHCGARSDERNRRPPIIPRLRRG